jgi:hypothetical protein
MTDSNEDAMTHRRGYFGFSLEHFGVIAALGAALVLTAAVMIGFTRPAAALPSFARQTGQPCGKCHTDFPALTPFGRRFKLGGYTLGGGEFRTTPFPSTDDSKTANDRVRSYVKSMDSGKDTDKGWVPPISMMTIVGFTHTQAPLMPPTAPYKTNDNTVLSPFSAFWGGAITDNIGAFAQVTYNAPPPGGFPDPFGHTWTWDNTDIRYAKSTTIGSLDVTFGVTANNNPTVQDVWNTTPAWTFPYVASTIASTPAAKTIIDGAFAAHVGGVGAYAFINDMLYLEASAYRTLDFRAQNSLGVDPFGAPGLLDGVAPYWRAAFEPHWGDHYLMVGTFGMMTNIHPWIDSSFVTGNTGTFPQTDKFTDAGFDAQYQYQGENYWLTLRGSYIREYQRLDATFGIGGSANPTNELNTLRLQSSLAYGGDHNVVLTGQYFDTWGTADPILYAGLASGLSPNSNGFTAEIAYIPFGTSQAPGWPWFNARLGLDYTIYEKFEGTRIGASGHNTLFLHLWLAM